MLSLSGSSKNRQVWPSTALNGSFFVLPPGAAKAMSPRSSPPEIDAVSVLAPPGKTAETLPGSMRRFIAATRSSPLTRYSAKPFSSFAMSMPNGRSPPGESTTAR